MDFPSVFTNADSVEILKAEPYFGFIQRVELVRMNGDEEPTEVTCYYTEQGLYVGSLCAMLIHYGVTEQFSPVVPNSNVASIGFNPIEQKWYGWSHRMIQGFGIGSEVGPRSCAFVPSSKEEFEAQLRGFWDDGVTRPCGNKETATLHDLSVTRFTKFEHDVVNPITDELGAQFAYETTFASGRPPLQFEDFAPYPNPWGRGAHTATTLEEAKEMAIAFALDVS